MRTLFEIELDIRQAKYIIEKTKNPKTKRDFRKHLEKLYKERSKKWNH